MWALNSRTHTHTYTYTHALHDLRKMNGFRSLCWCRMAVRAEWDAEGCYQILKSQNRAACIYLFCDFHSSTQLNRWRCILRRWCRQSINNGKVITRQTTSIANIFGRLDGTWTTNKIRNYYDRNVSSSSFLSFPFFVSHLRPISKSHKLYKVCKRNFLFRTDTVRLKITRFTDVLKSLHSFNPFKAISSATKWKVFSYTQNLQSFSHEIFFSMIWFLC